MSNKSLDLFLEACGAAESISLDVDLPNGSSSQYFQQPFVLIGRDLKADIQIDDKRLSHRHAYLQLFAGRLLFVNLKGLLSFPDSPVRQYGWIDPGQRQEFGPLSIRLAEQTTVPEWSKLGRTYPYDHGELSAINLELRSAIEIAQWRMFRPLALVGSSAACKIRLQDSRVSRIHCALVNTPLGLWVVDLLSGSGLTVNGEMVRAARLDVGDQLCIGGFSICPIGDPKRIERAEASLSQALYPSFGAPPEQKGDASSKARVRPAIPMAGTPADDPPQPIAALSAMQHTDCDIMRPSLDLTEAESPAALSQLGPDAATSAMLASPLFLKMQQFQQQMMMQMQQQMADQFQQAMGLFVDTFWSMHNQHTRAVRRELKRIRALTDELSDLQNKLAQVSAEPRQAPETPVAWNPPLAEWKPKEPDRKSNEVQKAASPSVPRSATPQRSTVKSPPMAPTGAPPTGPAPAELHAWLHQRVNKIQQKRTSAWLKILRLIQAKPAAESDAPTT